MSHAQDPVVLPGDLFRLPVPPPLQPSPSPSHAADSPPPPAAAAVDAASSGNGNGPQSARFRERVWLTDMNLTRFATFGAVFIVALETSLFPLNTLQTVMMADHAADPRRRSMTAVAAHMLRRHGPARFWRGAGTSVAGAFPGQIAYYLTYESTQELLRHSARSTTTTTTAATTSERDSFWRGFAAGATADVVAGVFYVPADVISQRLQTQGATDGLGFTHNNRLYRNGLDVARRILRTEGPRGFWRGYVGYVASFAPASAVQWGVYEWTKPLFSCLLAAPSPSSSSSSWSSPSSSSFSSSSTSSPSPSSSPSSSPWTDTAATALAGALAGVCAVCVNNPLEVVRVRLQLLDSARGADAARIRAGYLRLALHIFQTEGLPSMLRRGIRPRLLLSLPGAVLAMTGYEKIKEEC
ncbi:mitochondrial carrier domain-containing protein [Zopfochytrium polystomum]|nr:mitochondrial carrier domain-containing protein [Zopfochytrium polystomum]